MKIIIVGGGKTGATIAKTLTDEGHDVTVIESDPERLSSICDNTDVLGIAGNGMNYSALKDAGISGADILIAVTGSDEQNLLCCLFAKKTGNCSTIARVRNPLYITENNFIKDQVGLSMIINPELAAATEMSRLLRFPSAIEINTFAKGKLEQLTFKIPVGSVLDGKNLNYVRNKIESDLLFCAVKRNDRFYIPDGNFELKSGDRASIIISPSGAQKFFKKIGIDTHAVKNAMIIGGGTIAYYLAQQLLHFGISVKIIELDKSRANELSEKLPDALVIHGDASDKDLLLEEGIANTEAFVAVTNFDEENVLLSLYAKEMSDAKIITKINRIAFDSVINKLDLDSVIYPRNLTAEFVLQYVRAKENAVGNNVENLYKLNDDQVEAIEFKINENAPIIGIPLHKMRLKSNLLICGINRKGKIIIPGGDDTILAGDTVIVVTGHKKLNDVEDILE